MSPFEEHPLRKKLNDEIHARPPVALRPPERVSYLAFLHENDSAQAEVAHLRLLTQQLGLSEPDDEAAHLMIEAPEFRLKWERHSEFSSYAFFLRGETTAHVENDALLSVPTTWRKAIPGRLIVASQIEIRGADEETAQTTLRGLSGNGASQIISRISEGAGWVFTDFQLHDGFSRFMLLDISLTPRQAGRTVQRLLEIETYRTMALLAFPVAKEVGRLMSQAETELADLMDSIGEARSSEDERKVLGRLTRLAADVERSIGARSPTYNQALFN